MQIRKIETQSEIQKREARKKLIIGVILAGVMILSTAGFAFLNNPLTPASQSKQMYNGYEFILLNNGFWQTRIQGYDFQFQYLPNETIPVNLPGIDFSFFSGKPLYFLSDNQDATYEIVSNMKRFLPRVQNACIIGQNCTEDLPEKNCTVDNIILIKESNDTNIAADEKCITLSGAYADLVSLSDAFLYKIMGVK